MQVLVYQEEYLLIKIGQKHILVEQLIHQNLITLELMSSIPELSLSLREKDTSSSSFVENVCPDNLVFMDKEIISKEYFDDCFFSAIFVLIFTKKVIKFVSYVILVKNVFSVDHRFSGRLLFIFSVFPMISFIIS